MYSVTYLLRNKNHAPTFSYCGETRYEAIFHGKKENREKRWWKKEDKKRQWKEEKNNE